MSTHIYIYENRALWRTAFYCVFRNKRFRRLTSIRLDASDRSPQVMRLDLDMYLFNRFAHSARPI